MGPTPIRKQQLGWKTDWKMVEVRNKIMELVKNGENDVPRCTKYYTTIPSSPVDCENSYGILDILWPKIQMRRRVQTFAQLHPVGQAHLLVWSTKKCHNPSGTSATVPTNTSWYPSLNTNGHQVFSCKENMSWYIIYIYIHTYIHIYIHIYYIYKYIFSN